MRLAILSLAAAILAPAAAPANADQPCFRDGFDRPADWKAIAADGIGLVTSADADGHAGPCLKLDYDFTRGSGYAIVRRELSPPLELPPNHRVALQLKGNGPRNTLEVKLIERTAGGGGAAPGENVWWVNQRDYAFDGPWREVRLPRRKFTFAWGPERRDFAKRIDAIEIVVTSFNGGKGTVWLDELRIEPLPEVRPHQRTPSVDASSRAEGGGPLAIGPDGFIGWKSKPASVDPAPEATIDFGEAREFGGVAIEWEPGAHASSYEVSGSLGGEWFVIGKVRGGNGGLDDLVTLDAVASRVRIRCTEPADREGVRLRALTFLPPEHADDVNARLRLRAAAAPRGWWPRYLLGEASYWIVVGVEDDDREALVSEDGAIELGKQGPSLEPFVRSSGRLLSWHESTLSQRLADGYLPVPTVTRETAGNGGAVGLRLEVTCLADDAPPFVRGQGVVLARYRLTNTGSTRHEGSLFIAVRPMQVNPTYQFLNHAGGASRIGRVSVSDEAIRAGEFVVQPLTPAARVGACAFQEGEIVEHIEAGKLPAHKEVSDDDSLASAAMEYPFSLEAGAAMTVVIASPLHGTAMAWDGMAAAPAGMFEDRLNDVLARWRATTDRVTISLPSEGRKLWDVARSNLAYILINRDGAAIQPGSRSYERSWIRDGSLTSSSLLAFGLTDQARAFVDWYAPNQYPSGKVPCVVDRRGPDPVPEHDSDGEFIYAVMNLYRHTRDIEFLRKHWDAVRRAAGHIEFLRSQRLTEEFTSSSARDDRRVLAGLLPESISHEGYSAKPMHSYWDDFWGLKGISDAAEIATILGHDADASRLRTLSESFERSVGESIELAMRLKSISYIPGCAELGDFDATSTTIGVWPCDLIASRAMPDPALTETFQRYWRYFSDRRNVAGQAAEWVNYTPYEWRTVGTMLRLGTLEGDGASSWRERAHEAIAYFMADSRPEGFNHWAEVVWRDPRRPGFIGDMPHTWCGSDFINSFRSMLAFDDDRARRLVLGAGLRLSWVLDPDGVRVNGLGTHCGDLTYSVKRGDSPQISVWEIGEGIAPPSGGIWIAPPHATAIRSIRCDEDKVTARGALIPVQRIPSRIEVEYAR